MSVIKYRPAIDGLRAIAVISVLLYHLDKHLLPGGFIGVDIFFVISGYLITSVIINECEQGKFRFSNFYQRRISRIYPAFFLVSIAVLIGSYFLYLPQDFASAGSTAMSAALSVANLKFILQGNYFELSQDAQPFLHYWSLSVEEQFYMVFPLIIYLSLRLKISRFTLSVGLIIAAFLSFVVCFFMTKTNPTWAFYLLPTRAWKLLAGCILATYPHPKAINKWTEIIFHNIGLAFIALSLMYVHEGVSFPGYIAAIPVIGTVLLIGAGNHVRKGLVEKILSAPFLVFFGKISYSLYLWHWPIYSIIDYTLYLQSPLTRLVLKIILTALFSLSSYYYFEKPVRSFLNQPDNKKLSFAIFSVGVIILVAIGYFIRTNNYISANSDTVKSGGVTFNNNAHRPLAVIMGDSNASMYGLAMKEIAKEMDIRIHVISVAAGDPFPESKLFHDSLFFLDHAKPEITIFVAEWAGKVGADRSRLKLALLEILKRSKNIILITEPPRLPYSDSRQKIRESGQHQLIEEVMFSNYRKNTNRHLKSLSSNRIHVLDIDSLFVKNGEILFFDAQGRQLFQDDKHLSAYGSALVKKQLKIQIEKILSK